LKTQTFIRRSFAIVSFCFSAATPHFLHFAFRRLADKIEKQKSHRKNIAEKYIVQKSKQRLTSTR